MNRVLTYLQNNPRERKGSVEEDLLEIGINFYHIISLLWDRTTHKYTNEFLIWKTREILELFISNLPEHVSIEEVQNHYDECMLTIKTECTTSPEGYAHLFTFLGLEIDNYPNNNYGLPLELKIAMLIFLLEQKAGITVDQIFEKYNNL